MKGEDELGSGAVIARVANANAGERISESFILCEVWVEEWYGVN